MPASGKAFDQTIRGDVFVAKGGQIITESQWMGPNEWSAQTGYDIDDFPGVLTGGQRSDLIRMVGKKMKLPGYGDGGIVAETLRSFIRTS